MPIESPITPGRIFPVQEVRPKRQEDLDGRVSDEQCSRKPWTTRSDDVWLRFYYAVAEQLKKKARPVGRKEKRGRGDHDQGNIPMWKRIQVATWKKTTARNAAERVRRLKERTRSSDHRQRQANWPRRRPIPGQASYRSEVDRRAPPARCPSVARGGANRS